uniref:Uncharacterized protein n=1 Tax=Oryza brachyantha TaxID=4533 RepID=J3LAS5_ORYBR
MQSPTSATALNAFGCHSHKQLAGPPPRGAQGGARRRRASAAALRHRPPPGAGPHHPHGRPRAPPRGA